MMQSTELNTELMEAIKEINLTTADAVDYGAGNYAITVAYDTNAMAYQNFRNRLQDGGYQLYVDNSDAVGVKGNPAIADYVQIEVYTKANITFHLLFVKNVQMTQLIASNNQPMSKHLFYDAKELDENLKGAKTTLHNLPVCSFGDRLIIQLKNQHFIVYDGGLPTGEEQDEQKRPDTAYMIEYMENLVPSGTKPIIDAWIISHLHRDHCGTMWDFVTGVISPDCIIVEGIYYNEPNTSVFDLDPGALVDKDYVERAVKRLRTSGGKVPEIYRVRLGERYYFNDITMDIIFTQEQLPRECYFSVDFFKGQKRANFNDSSTWFLFTIEGQKVLFNGDADKGSMDRIMNFYDKEYMSLSAMTTSHHSWNPYQPYIDFITVDSVLVTYSSLTVPRHFPNNAETQAWLAPNAVLEEKAKECLGWENGAIIMEFPYKVGESKCRPIVHENAVCL